MEPIYPNGTLVDVLRYSSPVSVGDIIVFRSPTSPNRDFIKRVIAGPGQVVEIDGSVGQVKVDEAVIEEPYTRGTTGCTQSGSPVCRFEVPGLDRGVPLIPGVGEEARPLRKPEEEAAACSKTGCYFVLGDNRQNSSDSRGGWLVPTENIIGYIDQAPAGPS